MHVSLDEGSLLVLFFLLGCIGLAFLRAAERFFGLHSNLRRFVASGGIAVGVGVFLLELWPRGTHESSDLLRPLGAGVTYGLLTAVALTFIVPLILFVYHFLLAPCCRMFRITREPTPKDSRASTEARQRRENARASCEMLYHLHAPEFGERFTRQMLDDFLHRYLNEESSPEDVEARAGQLLDVMRQHADKGKGVQQGLSITDRGKKLEDQIRQIQESSLGDREKGTLIVMLKKQFVASLQKEIEDS